MKPVLFPKPNKKQTRSIVLVGLMGVGKTTVGRRLAAALGLPFFDADREIEKSAGRNVSDIFADFGESAFREGERKVVIRILSGQPCVLATGGGAFMDAVIREEISKRGTSIWLRAELDELLRRTKKRDTRPLLRTDDPKKILMQLMTERNPVYATADLVVDSDQGSHSITVNAIVRALNAYERPGL